MLLIFYYFYCYYIFYLVFLNLDFIMDVCVLIDFYIILLFIYSYFSNLVEVLWYKYIYSNVLYINFMEEIKMVECFSM